MNEPGKKTVNSGAFVESVTGSSVTIRQRVVNKAKRHPVPFAAVAVALVTAVSMTTYGLTSGDTPVSGSAVPRSDTRSAEPRVAEKITYEGSPTGLAYRADGRYLVLATYHPPTVHYIDTESNEVARSIGFDTSVLGITLSPDGRSVVVNNGGDGTVLLRDPETVSSAEFTLSGGFGAFTADSRFAVTKTETAFQLWDAATGALAAEKPIAPNQSENMLASQDGRHLLTYAYSEMTLWDSSSWTPVAVMASEDHVNSAAFNSAAPQLATGLGNGDIQVREVPTGDVVATLTGHSGPVRSTAFAPNGELLASAAEDGTIRLWDTGTWQTVAELPNYVDAPALAFSPDGTTLATCTDDGIHLWRLP